MRDRKALGQEGFCVVVATIDRRTGKLHKSPDIISRGFVYLRENKDLMDQTRLIIRKSVEGSFRHPRSADLDSARDELADSVARFLLQKTLKRPIVIPVILAVIYVPPFVDKYFPAVKSLIQSFQQAAFRR